MWVSSRQDLKNNLAHVNIYDQPFPHLKIGISSSIHITPWSGLKKVSEYSPTTAQVALRDVLGEVFRCFFLPS